MKIILSHDIDHLNWSEHYFKDLYLPGTLYRNTKGFIKGYINWNLYLQRLKCYGRMHNIPELLEYYSNEGIKANFFFGMDNALHLSYKYQDSVKLIELLLANKHSVGVHGIAYKDINKIREERNKFQKISNLQNFGIRTHYLRLSGYTHNLFSDQDYLFDSSIEGIMHPFRINSMWEIPISIMDASLVENAQLNQNLESWKENSLMKVSQAKKMKTPYFVINFHDIYFSDRFPVMRDWFIWLVDYLKNKNYEFVTLEEASSELNNKFK